MPDQPQEIEVEVVEIDGVPVDRPAPEDRAGPTPHGRQWQGRIRRLPPIWWPLAIIGGIIALALLLTVGVVVGACWLLIRAIRSILRTLAG